MAFSDTMRRFARTDGARPLLLLVAVTAAFAVAICINPYVFPLVLLLVPLIVASFLLGPRVLPWFIVYLMALLAVSVWFEPLPLPKADSFGVAVDFLIALIVLILSFRRSRLGVAGLRGESMFVDLRDRILNQGALPALPAGWYAESAISSAGGTLFAGDFVVAARPSAHRFEVALVDVSGKGEQAGTRALLLSGALGGLVGSVPPERFLPAANEYLLRQAWDEGFATAVHLAVDLTDGSYELRTAGHPPAIARLGRECVPLESWGPILGLVEDAEFEPVRGRLGDGDAVMLYTDGMVEDPRSDIDVGIGRLAAEARHQLALAVDGSARRLVDQLGSKDDDRCLVVVSHRPGWGA